MPTAHQQTPEAQRMSPNRFQAVAALTALLPTTVTDALRPLGLAE
jgi:hypothetical protein